MIIIVSLLDGAELATALAPMGSPVGERSTKARLPFFFIYFKCSKCSTRDADLFSPLYSTSFYGGVGTGLTNALAGYDTVYLHTWMVSENAAAAPLCTALSKCLASTY